MKFALDAILDISLLETATRHQICKRYMDSDG